MINYYLFSFGILKNIIHVNSKYFLAQNYHVVKLVIKFRSRDFVHITISILIILFKNRV